MSIKALKWALEEAPTTSGSQSAVLMFLAFKANENGFCWWSTEKIGAQLGMTGRNVRNHIDALADLGLVVKAKRRARPDGKLGPWIYWVPFRARPSKLPDGHPWPATTGNKALDQRDIGGIKIGAEACAQPVDEPVDNLPKTGSPLSLEDRKPTSSQKRQASNEETIRHDGNVTYIGRYERTAS